MFIKTKQKYWHRYINTSKCLPAVIAEVLPRAINDIDDKRERNKKISRGGGVKSDFFHFQIHFHGLDFEGLHRDIPPSKLPEEYGGQAPPLNFNAFWRRMDADENLFKENGRYGYRDAFVT